MNHAVMRLLSSVMTVVICCLCVINGSFDAGAPYTPEDPDAVLLNAVLITDIHTDGDTKRDRNILLTKLFSGINKSEQPLDVLAIAGDITNSATWNEYMNLEAMLKIFPCANRIVPASGNHDEDDTSDGKGYEGALRRYLDFCEYCGVKTETPYWRTFIKGYCFIVLGSDAQVHNNAYISPEQLAFLDESLTAARRTGKPAFILSHQPLAGTNDVDVLWSDGGTLGEQSNDVFAVIQKHTDAGQTVVYISGHLHESFHEKSFESPSPRFYCLNLPSSQYTDGGGIGMTLECYANRVLLRGRNFITGVWLDVTYEIRL